MEENKLLSIGIPTYNRACFLEETLMNFIPQVKEYAIPIIISDNCSTDNTQEVVEKCRKIYPYIIYSKNYENLGFDMNVQQIMKLCSTSFCWLFGDDDRIVDHAITQVMNNLTTEYAFVLLSTLMYNSDMTEMLSLPYSGEYSKIYLPKDSNQFFKDAFLSVGFIGACIVNTELWKSVDSGKFMKGKGYVHVGVIMEYVFGRKVLHILEPLVKDRWGNASWFNDYMNISFVYLNHINNELNTYDNVMRLKELKSVSKITLKMHLTNRALGVFNYQHFKQLIWRNAEISFIKKLVIGFIATVPHYFFSKMYLCYLHLIKPKDYKLALCAMNNIYIKKRGEYYG